MRIETERLIITEFSLNMAQAVHENSLDDDNRRFVPDEVFETADDARETIGFLMSQYGRTDGPLVYPVLIRAGRENIGYVQLVPKENGTWEIGYHIAKAHTGNGYAAEAVRAFLPVVVKHLGIKAVYGICMAENTASRHVLDKCGFTPVYEGTGDYQGQKREIYKSIWRSTYVFENHYITYLGKKIKRIRTGGQSGADRAAMDFAREWGIPLCGWCPKGGWAEDYPDPPGVLSDYPELTETPSKDTAQRTKWNMRDSDAILTIIPANAEPSPGTDLGLAEGESLGKPMLTVKDAEDLPEIIRWLHELPEGIVLCIGGPRASECPEAYNVTKNVLDEIAATFKC